MFQGMKKIVQATHNKKIVPEKKNKRNRIETPSSGKYTSTDEGHTPILLLTIISTIPTQSRHLSTRVDCGMCRGTPSPHLTKVQVRGQRGGCDRDTQVTTLLPHLDDVREGLDGGRHDDISGPQFIDHGHQQALLLELAEAMREQGLGQVEQEHHTEGHHASDGQAGTGGDTHNTQHTHTHTHTHDVKNAGTNPFKHETSSGKIGAKHRTQTEGTPSTLGTNTQTHRHRHTDTGVLGGWWE